MIKRPLNPQFADPVRRGIKTTTIRARAWPVGVPIMFYQWSGAPYRSKHVDIVPIMVESVQEITIHRHETDDRMFFAFDRFFDGILYASEGFRNQRDLDDWFRPLVKPGQTVTKHLMHFRRHTDETESCQRQPAAAHRADQHTDSGEDAQATT